MEPQIGHFADKRLRCATVPRVLRGQHDFGGFFADLFKNGIVTFMKESGNVGLFRIATLAAIDNRREASSVSCVESVG